MSLINVPENGLPLGELRLLGASSDPHLLRPPPAHVSGIKLQVRKIETHHRQCEHMIGRQCQHLRAWLPLTAGRTVTSCFTTAVKLKQKLYMVISHRWPGAATRPARRDSDYNSRTKKPVL